jgi:hypothetical protein
MPSPKPIRRKLAEQLTQKVLLRLDGKDWPLVITHNVLIDCEELTGLNVLSGEVNLLRPSAKLVRALLYLSLKNAGAKYTLSQIGDFITPDNIVLIQEGILQAWAASMPAKADLDAENPTKATAAK